MLIRGIKMTHHAGVAVIEGSKLVFSLEFEKLNNNFRHTHFNLSIPEFREPLGTYGYAIDDFDRLVFDGWHTQDHHNYILEGFPLQIALMDPEATEI